jgi:putative ABC transport system permease protein
MRSLGRATRSIARSPLRSSLIVCLLAVSLSFAAALMALGSDTRARLAATRDALGTAIELRPAGSFGPIGVGTLADADIRAAAGLPGVLEVEEQIAREYQGTALKGATTLGAGLRYVSPTGTGPGREGTLPPWVNGVTPGRGPIVLLGGGTATIVAGRDLRTGDAEANVALLSRALAGANGLRVGDRFSLGDKPVEIVGLYTTGQGFSDNSLVMPVRALQRLLGLDGVSALTVRAVDASRTDEVAARLRQVFGGRIDVITASERQAGTLRALEETAHMSKIVVAASLAAASLVIVFAVFIIVRERAGEIGIRKALGASGPQVVALFGAEVLILGVVATVVSLLLLGLLGGPIVGQFVADAGHDNRRREVPVEQAGTPAAVGTGPTGVALSPISLLTVLGAGGGLATLASGVAALQVARVRSAEVLRQAPG